MKNYLINNVMGECFKTSLNEAKKMLIPFLQDFINLYENELLPLEDDWRSGHDTYGYESEKHILYNLLYISDRWRCAFRVRWIIDLLKKDYYPYEGHTPTKE